MNGVCSSKDIFPYSILATGDRRYRGVESHQGRLGMALSENIHKYELALEKNTEHFHDGAHFSYPLILFDPRVRIIH
jgi:hypothetical protein